MQPKIGPIEVRASVDVGVSGTRQRMTQSRFRAAATTKETTHPTAHELRTCWPLKSIVNLNIGSHRRVHIAWLTPPFCTSTFAYTAAYVVCPNTLATRGSGWPSIVNDTRTPCYANEFDEYVRICVDEEARWRLAIQR